jgi:hypothetical protein
MMIQFIMMMMWHAMCQQGVIISNQSYDSWCAPKLFKQPKGQSSSKTMGNKKKLGHIS